MSDVSETSFPASVVRALLCGSQKNTFFILLLHAFSDISVKFAYMEKRERERERERVSQQELSEPCSMQTRTHSS